MFNSGMGYTAEVLVVESVIRETFISELPLLLKHFLYCLIYTINT